MTIKLDMSRAFDRLEWSFFKQMLRHLGFNEKWISLMMECVKSFTYSILVSGEPKGLIKPTSDI